MEPLNKDRALAHVLTDQEREYVADILQWGLQAGIATTEIRSFVSYDEKKKCRVPAFKCCLHFIQDNDWKYLEYKANNVTDLRSQMGKVMWEKMDEAGMYDGDQCSEEDEDEDIL